MQDILMSGLGTGNLANLHLQDQAHLQYSLPNNLSPALYRLNLTPGTSKRIVIMVQKEVAQRPYAPSIPPKTMVFNFEVKLQFDTTLLEMVGRECFDPPPKVDSAIIMLTPKLTGQKSNTLRSIAL